MNGFARGRLQPRVREVPNITKGVYKIALDNVRNASAKNPAATVIQVRATILTERLQRNTLGPAIWIGRVEIPRGRNPESCWIK